MPLFHSQASAFVGDKDGGHAVAFCELLSNVVLIFIIDEHLSVVPLCPELIVQLKKLALDLVSRLLVVRFDHI